MQKYYWNVTLINGKEYVVETEYSDINRFLNQIYKADVVTTLRLKNSNSNGNAVAIKGDYVVSVEYGTE